MNIIEKLGITPIKKGYYGLINKMFYYPEDVEPLESNVMKRLRL